MKTCRDMMRENNDNLDWCRPESYLDDRVILAINEGTVVGINIDGADEAITPDAIRRVARMVNEDYDLYKGWDDVHIIQCAAHEELPCHRCPWFEDCDAMDEEDEEWEGDEED